MPNNNIDIQRKASFFHSLGRVLTESNKSIGNEKYKSSHNILSNEVWIDSIPYAPTLNIAIQNYSENTDIIKIIGSLSTPAILYPLSGSNYQTWFLDLGDPTPESNGFNPSVNWCKPLINPTDVSDSSGAPSFGYEALLFRPNLSQISYNNTFYDVDYFSGLIRFDSGKTPIDSPLNSGLAFQFDKISFESSVDKLDYIRNINNNPIRAIAFQYIGKRLSDFDITENTSGKGITISNNEVSVLLSNQSGLTFSSENDLIINVDKTGLTISNNLISLNDIIEGEKTFSDLLTLNGVTSSSGFFNDLKTDNNPVQDFDVINLNYFNDNVIKEINVGDGLTGGGVASTQEVTTAPLIGGSGNPGVFAIDVQSNGKIIIAGSFTLINNGSKSFIARLNPDLTLDETFQTVSNARVNYIEVQSNDKILIGGDFSLINGQTRNNFARLNSDGTLDESFNSNSVHSFSGSGLGYLIKSDNNGKILLYTSDDVVKRVNSDGSIDNTFSTQFPEPAVTGGSLSLDLQSDGKIIISKPLTRLNTDGTVSNSIIVNDFVRKVKVQSDDKILIIGDFSEVDGESRLGIARLNADFTLDNTFTPSLDDLQVLDIKIDTDNKILVSGAFNFINAQQFTPIRGLIRLNSDGTLDESLVVTDASASVIKVEDSGNILLGGQFLFINGKSSARLARVSSTGVLETKFISNNTISIGLNIDSNTIKFDNNSRVSVSGSTVYQTALSSNTSGNNQSTGLSILYTPLSYSSVKVYINGQILLLGNSSTNFDCYFSDDGGVTAKSYNDIASEDVLYFNGSNVGWDLSEIDRIILVYESNVN